MEDPAARLALWEEALGLHADEALAERAATLRQELQSSAEQVVRDAKEAASLAPAFAGTISFIAAAKPKAPSAMAGWPCSFTA